MWETSFGYAANTFRTTLSEAIVQGEDMKKHDMIVFWHVKRVMLPIE